LRTFPQTSFKHMKTLMAGSLIRADLTDVGEWQAQKIDNPLMITRELTNVIFDLKITNNIEGWQTQIEPNLPWAEDHFNERVSGEPLNPAPSEAWWPYAQRGTEDHKIDFSRKFSHTYPERFWPKFAENNEGNMGIRYNYGDLNDVVALLKRSPMTRQAYLPVWFPEDTGANYEQRVPCTLGYHFLLRNGVLGITYFIRSCDFVRHFSDDVYMAGRLCQWVADQVADGNVGYLSMHIGSFHIFDGDVAKLKRDYGF
jgi:hypothetical protein